MLNSQTPDISDMNSNSLLVLPSMLNQTGGATRKAHKQTKMTTKIDYGLNSTQYSLLTHINIFPANRLHFKITIPSLSTIIIKIGLQCRGSELLLYILFSKYLPSIRAFAIPIASH